MRRMKIAGALLFALRLADAPAQEEGATAEAPPSTAPPTRAFVSGAASTGDVPGFAVRPLVGLGGQFFSVMALSGADVTLPRRGPPPSRPPELGPVFGFLGVELKGVPSGAAVRVAAEAPPFLRPSTFLGRAYPADGVCRVFPRLSVDSSRLAAMTHAEAVELTFAVEAEACPPGHASAPLVVRPPTECPIALVAAPGSGESDLDLSWLLAAYADEDHPWTEQLLRDAAAAGVVTQFYGYAEGADGVHRQVFALWSVLRDRGLVFRDEPVPEPAAGQVITHLARPLADACGRREGTATDGAVLMASVLRRAGLRAYLVRRPGNLLAAFGLDARGGQVVALDLTALDHRGETAAAAAAPAELAQTLEGRAAATSYREALARGAARMEDVMGHHADNDPAYRVVNLDDARAMGVHPLRAESR